MNERIRRRKRYSQKVSFGTLVWMVMFAVIASGSGVLYAVLKNDQVAVRTEISKLNREIAICRMNANQYRAKTDALTNRWAMRERLIRDGSSLRDIQHGQIETAIRDEGADRRVTATR